MNLREFCRLDGFDTTILTTYQFDPVFFERVVLRDLVASGVRRVIVLADGPQSQPAIESAHDQLVDLGRRYQLFQAWTAGAFHAKLCIKIGPAEALVACGSTNLTYPGWLGVRSDTSKVGNHEASGAWRVLPGSGQAADLERAIRAVMAPLSESARRAVEQAALLPWIADSGSPPEGRLLVSSGEQALSTLLAQRWRGRRFGRMWMATGSTDRAGAMLAWAANAFGIEAAVVELDPESAVFDPTLLVSLPLQIRVRVRAPQPRPHLKVAVFEENGTLAAIYGSANCSAAGWLQAPARGGNTEAIVVLDAVERAALSPVLALDDDGAVSLTEVPFATTGEFDRESDSDAPRLVRAVLSRALCQLTCEFDRPIEDSESVLVAIDEYEASATARRPDTWVAQFATLPERSRTRFVTVNILGSFKSTCRCWVEDAESLDAMRAKTIDIGAVADLGDRNKAGDSGSTLRGISKLSHWLLGEWSADDERTGARSENSGEEPKAPATPVTPEKIFQSLDEMKGPSHALAMQVAGASISLIGIMRLVFGSAVTAGVGGSEDTVAEELRDDRKGERASAPGDEDLSDDEVDTSEVSASDRSRLIRQVQRFVDSMSEPGFADRCTARQLQQAVAFPLACSLLAAGGGWIQSREDQTGWRAIVRGVCELLLVARSGGSRPGESSTLIECVRGRYAEDGRVREFDAIVGDGTLWVLLLAVATGTGVESDPLERQLLLTDVLGCEHLRSQRSAVQLAELCAVANVQDRSGEWLQDARCAHERVMLLRSRLSPLAASLPARSSGKPQVGDWLWNKSVGFARIEALDGSGSASVHIRQRAQTRPNVRLDYYINLRLAGLCQELPLDR